MKIKPKKSATSMKQAASLWGISLQVIKIAKSEGCPAFVGSRIHRDDLISWLEKNPSAAGKGEALNDIAELKRQKLEEEVTLLRSKIAREDRVTIPLEEAKMEWGRASAIVQEEAKNLMEKTHYRIFIERCKSRIGNMLD